MPFLLRDMIDEKITYCFVLLLNWYHKAIRKESHTNLSLAEMRKAGIRWVTILYILHIIIVRLICYVDM